jgi:xanthine/uracil permease
MKPSNLQYAVDDRPPLGILVGSALQHWMLGLASLAFPLLVIDAARRAGQITPDQVHSLLMISYLALGVSTLLQSLRGRWLGSGFLIPSVFTAAFLPANLEAVQAGGLGLVFGMTIFAGVAEVLLALFIRRFPQLFPPEAAGIVVLLVGLVLGMLGIRLMFSVNDDGSLAEQATLGMVLAGVTLVVAVALAVWAKGTLRALSVMIGMVAGTLTHLLWPESAGASAAAAPLDPVEALAFVWPIAIPSFSLDLVFPFLAAALVCALRAVGDITIAQRINDAAWKRPEPKSLNRGVVADGLGNVAAGALGSVGLNTFSGSVGMSLATGITSRWVGFALAGVYGLAAFIPGLADLSLHVPRPVLGAAMLLSACFILTNAMQAISAQALDNRKILVVSLAFFLGLSQHFYPSVIAELPVPLRHLLNSELTVGVLVLIILVPLFRLGTSRSRQCVVALDGGQHDTVARFIQDAASAMGARVDMMSRAVVAVTEFIELAPSQVDAGSPITLSAHYDDFTLRLQIHYAGRPLDAEMVRTESSAVGLVSQAQRIDEGEQALRQFGVGLMRRMCDDFKAGGSGRDCWVQLSFR